MVEIGRDLWRSSNPTPLLNQGQPEQAAQDHVLVYLRGWRLQNLSGQPLPVLVNPHSNKVFTDVQKAPPVFQFVPITYGPVTGHH